MSSQSLTTLLEKACTSRAALFDPAHETAFRFLNGFTEGNADLVIDIYASTAVLHNYAEDPAQGNLLIQEAQKFLSASLPWLKAGIVKTRNGETQDAKRGTLLFGTEPDRKVRENGIWYSVNLTMNRDSSLYLDTRNLRQWLTDHARGKTVMNTFAYTGSFGVAALKGGASRVVQIDLSRQFLNVAKDSYVLNGLPIQKGDFISRDFFEQVGNMKREKRSFDWVIIDPPFFSSTAKGKVDQVHESERLINKVRPLINDGGTLIAINNAVFVSGQEYLQTLESLCKDGYLKIREFIPVPEDFTGYNPVDKPITDPSPFNHSTKIAILDVKRKAS